VTSADVDEWSKKGMERMAGFEEEFYRVEREAEKKGWMKVCPVTAISLSYLCSIPLSVKCWSSSSRFDKAERPLTDQIAIRPQDIHESR